MDSLIQHITKIPIKDSFRIAKTAIESVKLNVVSEPSNEWIGYTISFAGSLVGAAVAVWAAVWTLRRNNKTQLGNEQRKAIALRRDKIRYFGMLLNSVIASAKTNSTFLKVAIQKIEEDKVNFHQLSMTPNHDLKRVSEELELESYMLAFANEPEIKDGHKEFRTIMKNVDYLHYEIRELPNLVMTYGTENLKHKEKLKEMFEGIRVELKRIEINKHLYTPEIVNGFFNFYESMSGKELSSSDLNDAFVGFNKFAGKALITHRDQNLEKIATLSLTGLEIFIRLVQDNEIYLDSLKAIHAGVDEAYNELLATNQVRKMFPLD